MNSYKFSEILIGLEDSFSVDIDEQLMEKFMEISGDVNPLHTEKDFAQNRGFNNKVVYGLLTSSFYSRLVGVYLPGTYCVLHGIDIKFSQPVYVGDKLTVYGKIVYINKAYQQLEIKAHILNQALQKVSKANIKVGMTNG